MRPPPAPGETTPGSAVAPGADARDLAPSLPWDDLPPVVAAGAETPSEPVQPVTLKMLARVQLGLRAIDAAIADGSEYLALTDPDARMMSGGRDRLIREC